MTNDDNKRLTEKIDEDKESETHESIVAYGRRMYRSGLIYGLVGLLPITAGSGFIASQFCQESKTTVAKRAAMEIYEPIGNSGRRGKITEDRQKMFEKMGRVYCAALNMPKQTPEAYILIGRWGTDGGKQQ